MSGGHEDVLRVPLDELSDTLALSDTSSVGPMMYAVVSHYSWDGLNTEERIRSVTALGLSARNEGYSTVYLVDENREQLATWSASDGARLVTAPLPAP